MSIINYEELIKKVIGISVPKPPLGILSDEIAGGAFDKLVYTEIKKMFPNETYKQCEYITDLFLKHPKVITYQERVKLLGFPTVMFLFGRLKATITKLEEDNVFDEKQNETADVLVIHNDFYEVVNVTMRNLGKKMQLPSIISGYKLALLCIKMVDNEEFNSFTIQYFGIDWLLEGDNLVCKNAHSVNLFKATPETLYVNWASGIQIEFDIDSLDQSFSENKEEWAKRYLIYFSKKIKQNEAHLIG